MNRKQMRDIGHGGCHQCAPKDWRNVPVLTGDYDLDATVLHRNNKDLVNRMSLYVRKSGKTYGMKTGYSGTHGYHGDE